MRIIGYIEHPVLKITVFKMDNRLSVKLETGQYEQTYKFRSGEGVETLEDMEKVVDPAFQQAVLAQFEHMHKLRGEAMGRNLQKAEEDEFPRLI
jgi:hypothetical protein